MKKMIGLLAMTILSSYSFSQETLQTVTARGNVATTPIIVELTGLGVSGYNIATNQGSIVNYTYDSNTGENRNGGLAPYVYSTFYSGGSERMRILNNGNVGIGTTAPAYKLDVNGSGRFYRHGDADFLLLDHQGTQTWRHGISTANTSTYVISNDLGGQSANKILALTHVGNVGIGTTSPTNRLSVNGTADFQTRIGFNNKSQYVGDGNMFSNSIGGINDFGIRNDVGDILLAAGSASPQFILKPSGNVGIGTMAPAYKLDVNGAIRAMNNVALKRDNVDNGIELQTEAFSSYMNIQASNSGFNSAKNLSLNAYGGNVGIGTVTPVYKLDINGGFRSGDNGSNFLYNGYADVIMSAAGRGNGGRAFVHGEGNRLVMNYGGDFSGGTEIGRFIYFSETGGVSYINTGNVGIGTLDPGSYKLAVEGTIGTRKIKVTQETWADYVFDSSYQLPSLSHVETFIKENKHLPEVPSAADVKKDGLDLGDNQAVLLKKIEELTLYIIQQNKKIEHMGKELEEVKAIQRNSGQR